MDGFGVNTFILQNKEGKEVYVKFNWKTEEGAFSYTPTRQSPARLLIHEGSQCPSTQYLRMWDLHCRCQVHD